jgi:hypothetical protein
MVVATPSRIAVDAGMSLAEPVSKFTPLSTDSRAGGGGAATGAATGGGRSRGRGGRAAVAVAVAVAERPREEAPDYRRRSGR